MWQCARAAGFSWSSWCLLIVLPDSWFVFIHRCLYDCAPEPYDHMLTSPHACWSFPRDTLQPFCSVTKESNGLAVCLSFLNCFWFWAKSLPLICVPDTTSVCFVLLVWNFRSTIPLFNRMKSDLMLISLAKMKLIQRHLFIHSCFCFFLGLNTKVKKMTFFWQKQCLMGIVD